MHAPQVLALIDAATLHHAVGAFGTTRASLVATRRFVFIVPHSAQAVPLLVGYLPPAQRVGPSAEQLGAALQHMLDQPNATAAQVESWLSAALAPEHVIELAALDTYKVESSAMSRGFYLKEPGAVAWSSYTLSADAARRLAAFLPPPATGRGSSSDAASWEQKPGARLKGAGLILAGLALYAVGIGSALVIPGFVIIFCGFFAPLPVFSGVYRVFKGEPIDPRTGRAPGAWSSGNAIAVGLGVLVGFALIYPTLELGRVVYQAHHGIEERDEDVQVPTWDPVKAGHDPETAQDPPRKEKPATEKRANEKPATEKPAKDKPRRRRPRRRAR